MDLVIAVDDPRAGVAERGDFQVHDLAGPLDTLESGSFDLVVMALVIHLGREPGFVAFRLARANPATREAR